MSEDRKSLENDASGRKSVPSNELWEALRKTLDVFGPSLKEATLSELQNSGLDFDPARLPQFTLDDLKEKLIVIFGEDGTEVIMAQLAKNLATRESRETKLSE